MLQEDVPQRRTKSVALRSNSGRGKALQAKEKSETSEGSSEEDELSLISRRINHLWKHRQGRRSNEGPRNTKGRFESTSGQKKADDKDITCFECKEPGHYKNECPKHQKERRPKKFYKKKGLKATWDDSQSEEDSEEEQATIALMGITKFESEAELSSEDGSDSDKDKVLSSFTPSELNASLF